MLIYNDTCTVQCTHYNMLHRDDVYTLLHKYNIRCVVVIVVVVIVVVESIIRFTIVYNTCLNCIWLICVGIIISSKI